MTTPYEILVSGITFECNLDYLLPHLRIHLGDLNPASYRYTNEWLRASLAYAVKALQPWWNYKYTLDETTYNAERNPRITFLFPEPPTIQQGDDRPIVLMASVLIKNGALEENAWSIGTWRDAEIYYSNTEGGRYKLASLEKDIEELENYLKPPTKRLAQSRKGSLPGYKNNRYETNMK